jgi:F0F1-type ATP synthase assembly protein I
VNKWILASRFIGVGFFIGISIILGILLGRWVGSLLHTPLLVIAGLLLGIFVAFWGVYRMLKPLLENDKNNRGNNK